MLGISSLILPYLSFIVFPVTAPLRASSKEQLMPVNFLQKQAVGHRGGDAIIQRVRDTTDSRHGTKLGARHRLCDSNCSLFAAAVLCPTEARPRAQYARGWNLDRPRARASGYAMRSLARSSDQRAGQSVWCGLACTRKRAADEPHVDAGRKFLRSDSGRNRRIDLRARLYSEWKVFRGHGPPHPQK
jgi:hypothetical protein